MLTITSKVQMDHYRKEKNLLTYEQMVNMNEAKNITSRITAFKEDAVAAGKETVAQWNKTHDKNNQKAFDEKAFTKELESDDTYSTLTAYGAALEERNNSIDSELKVLNSAIESFEKEHQAGIKEDTTFWCFGG